VPTKEGPDDLGALTHGHERLALQAQAYRW
jgi:hypothetical protein